MKCQIISVDAWRESEGGWTWNDSYRVGEIEIDNPETITTRQVLTLLREEGYLTEYSKGRVRVDDPGCGHFFLEIQDRGTYRPLFAIEGGDW